MTVDDESVGIDVKCCYEGCSRPASQTIGGKILCTDHYNEEYMRRLKERKRGSL